MLVAARLTTMGIVLSSSIPSLGAERVERVESAARGSTSDYRSMYRGLIIGGGFEMGAYGEALPATAGAQTAGIKSFAGRQLLLTWDAAGGVVGGYGGNEHPGFWFIGGRVHASGELGYRFLHERAFSPYAGAGADFALSAVDVSSAPAGGPNAANNLDGLAGETGAFATRYSAGASYLNEGKSFVLTLFVDEALRPKAGASIVPLFYEIGIHAQYDVSKNFSVLVEALYGTAAKKSEGSFGSTTEAKYEEARIAARKMFGKGFWIAVDGKVAERGNTTTYAGSPITYVTSGPVSPSVALTLGIPIE
jgi:hypothetical protein